MIEKLIDEGATQAAVARKYNLGKPALCRHLKHRDRPVTHPPDITAYPPPSSREVAIEPPAETKSLDAYERLVALTEKSQTILEKAEEKNDTNTVLWASMPSSSNLNEPRLLGSAASSTTVTSGEPTCRPTFPV